MTVNFTMAKIPHPTRGWAVRLFMSRTEADGDKPRDMNAALNIVNDLMTKRADELPEDERLISDDEMPSDAVPLFAFYLSVKCTPYGFVYARDWTRFDGCPAAVSTKGMELCDYVWSRANKQNKLTKERARKGERVKTKI